MATLTITGYEVDGSCEHCGRKLKHCIRLSDGRIVGATCLDKALTKPKKYQGKEYRLGSDMIIRAAKCVQLITPGRWSRYGIHQHNVTFETIEP